MKVASTDKAYSGNPGGHRGKFIEVPTTLEELDPGHLWTTVVKICGIRVARAERSHGHKMYNGTK